MVNRVDGVILGVGIVVLVASIIGVLLYDEQSPEAHALSWTESSEAIELDPASDSGGPTSYTFETEVDQEALSRAEFAVQVSASGLNVNADSVDVEVAGPGNETGSCNFNLAGGETDPSGGCTAEIEINTEPEISSIDAGNTSEAEQMAMAQASFENASGTWETTVTIDGGNEVSDPSYDVTLQPSLYQWTVTAATGGADTRAG